MGRSAATPAAASRSAEFSVVVMYQSAAKVAAPSRKDGGGLPRPDERDGALPVVGQQVAIGVDLNTWRRGFGGWNSR